MLPSTERLTRLQFPLVLTHPSLKTVYNTLGTLKYVLAEHRKCAVIISSKHEKSAVTRNKLRRRIYTQMTQFPGSAVFYASKQSYTMDYQQIERLWHELLTKVQKTTK
jgi:ribonuclease P protein component